MTALEEKNYDWLRSSLQIFSVLQTDQGEKRVVMADSSRLHLAPQLVGHHWYPSEPTSKMDWPETRQCEHVWEKTYMQIRRGDEALSVVNICKLCDARRVD